MWMRISCGRQILRQLDTYINGYFNRNYAIELKTQ